MCYCLSENVNSILSQRDLTMLTVSNKEKCLRIFFLGGGYFILVYPLTFPTLNHTL